MNQSFKKKAIVVSLASAFVLTGAGFVGVPGASLVSEAHANAFEDTTNVVSVSAGVTVPVTSSATLANQIISITETVQGAVFGNDGTIVLKLDNGKWKTLGSLTLSTTDQAMSVGTAATDEISMTGGATGFATTKNAKISTDGKSLTLTFAGAVTGTITGPVSIQLRNITLDTSGVAVGTAINASIDATSTMTGLTAGAAGKLATTSAAAVTITNPTATKIAAGAASGNLPTFSFTENIPTSVGTTAGAIKLSLKGGYTWTQRPDAAGVTMDNGSGTAVSGQTSADATYKINAQTSGSTKATITFGGVTAGTVFVPAGSTGDIVATLTVLDESSNVIATQDVTFANIVTKGLTAVATQVSGKTGFDTIFTGRIYDAASDFTAKNLLQVKEALGDSVVAGSSVSFTYGGAKWVDDAATPVVLTNTFNATAASGKEGFTLASCAVATGSSVKLSCTASDGANTSTASDISYGFRGVNTIGATAGDLTVLVESNSASSPSAVKVAEIKNATSISASGAVPTLISGSSAMALPDVVITEAAAGALDAGYFAMRLPSGVTFDTATAPTVTVTKSDGTALTGKVSAVSTGNFLDSGAELQLQVAAQTTSADGAMTIKVSGLKVKSASTAAVGNVSMTMFGVTTGGTTSVTDDRSSAKKDAGAKPTKTTLNVASVVSDANPSYPTVTVSDSTKAVISGIPLTAAGNDQGKPGSIYVAFIFGSQVFFMNSSQQWTAYSGTTPTAYFTGNLSTTNIDVLKTAADLSSLKGGQLVIGYGLGLAGLSNPFDEMLRNSRYNVVYTVQ